MRIEWIQEALQDVAEIIAYWYGLNPEAAEHVYKAIIRKIEWIADDRAMAGGQVKGLNKTYRQAFAIKTRYRIIYSIQEENGQVVRILMVRDSKRQKPTTQEITDRDKG